MARKRRRTEGPVAAKPTSRKVSNGAGASGATTAASDKDEEHQQACAVVMAGFEKLVEAVRKAKLRSDRSIGDVRPLTVAEWTDVHKTLYDVFYPNSHQRKLKMFRAMRHYLNSVVLEFCQAVEEPEILEGYRKCWEGVVIVAKYVSKLSSAANRWIASSKNTSKHDRIDQVDILMLSMLKENIEDKLPKVVEKALQLIDEDRQGYMIDSSLVKTAVMSLVALGDVDPVEGQARSTQKSANASKLYVDLFERPFLIRTGAYYRQKAAKLVEKCTVAQFMREIQSLLEAERQRSSKFLDACPESSLFWLKDAMERELIGSQRTFMYSDTEQMIRSDKRDELQLLFQLSLKLTDGVQDVRKIFQRFVTEEGFDAIRAWQDSLKDGGRERKLAVALIKKLVEIHNERTKLVEECFGSSEVLHTAVEDSFATFLNKQRAERPKMSEVLAEYADEILRSDRVSQDELEEQLVDVLKLFTSLHDKDMFVAAYSKQLSVRLLLVGSRSVCEDSELVMIEKLKVAGGHTLAASLVGMLTDMKLSRSLTMRFLADDKEASEHSQDLSVKILNSRHWPLKWDKKFVIHEAIQKRVEPFVEWYNKQTTHRKLEWMYCGTVTLAAHLNRTYELVCTALQASVLLLFNDREEVSESWLQERCGCGMETLEPYLKAMPLLALKDGMWTLDQGFRSKKVRVELTLVTRGLMRDEVREKTQKTVNVNRTVNVDAAIVRIMKARKEISHGDLVSEVVTQLSNLFRPDVKLIKTRIEQLIEKDYMQRTEADSNMFSYLN